MLHPQTVRLIALSVFLGCSGCDEGASGPVVNGGAINSITVAPSGALLAPGETRDFSAMAFNASGAAVTGTTFSWSTSDASVATVGTSGQVTAVGPGSATIRAAAGGKSGQAALTVMPQPSGLVVDVVPGVGLQTMRGWEGVTQIGQVECNRTAYPIYRQTIIDRLVNELGINRVRLEVRSGSENPSDWFARHYFQQSIAYETYRDHRYEVINDNADPFSINPAGFFFSELDNSVDEIVNPMRTRLSARGERLFVNLNYVDFAGSAFEHSSNPQEYAEFMLAIFQHLQSKYGWVPDAIEVILEPDNTPNWRPQTIGAVIVATGDRLKAAGFNPDVIAPANTDASRALQYFDELVQIPRVREYLTDLSYHRYAGVSASVIQAIGARTQQFGLRSGMLEHIGSSVDDLYEDITVGMNSAWQQFALAGCNTGDRPGLYYTIDVSTPTQPQVNLGSRGKLLRQYFRFVRFGAVRIGALSGDTRLAPLAFRNPDGKLVVVVKTTQGTSFQVRLLPAGTYGIKYTTPAQYDVDLADVTIGNGGVVPVSIPASGVITIYRR